MPQASATAEGVDRVAADRSLDAVEIVEVLSRSERRAFLDVPASIYRDDPAWVAPLRLERARVLDPRHNPYFADAEVRLWLALKGGKPVGRISAQINRRYAERYDPHTGHFGFIEAIPCQSVFAALFAAAEGWLCGRGMTKSLGPFNFSINDECGLLIDGFDTPPVLMMGHARPYYGAMVEAAGYSKAKDVIAYTLELEGRPIPASVQRMIDRAKTDPRIHLRPFTRATYADDLATMVDIFNDAWSDNWGFLPITNDEIAHMAKELSLIVHNYSACIADVDGKPAAFALALPNLNEAIRDLNGRLFPLGWARLLYRLKLNRIRSVRVPLMGVRRLYRSTALGAVLAYAVIDGLYERHRQHGFETAEMSWILEDNLPMRHLIEAVGGRPYKTYRLYGKDL